MKVSQIGLDLAKDVFQVHGISVDDVVVVRKRLTRTNLLKYFATLERTEHCIIGMESCCGSDHWARELIKLGYDVKIMNPSFVKPYVKSNKNDMRDAEAICEAVGRPTMRFISIKTLEQQDLILFHKQRHQMIRRRTAQANQMRGLLMNYGIVIAKRISCLRQAMPQILDNEHGLLTTAAIEVFQEMYAELVSLDEKISRMDKRLEGYANSRTDCQRLMTIPGIGVLTATGLVAWLGNGSQFRRARDCSAYLGLIPKQYSSGNSERLGGISKRGNSYLRMLLIHGARSDLLFAHVRQTKEVIRLRDDWSLAIEKRRHANIATVALANKNLRIAFALLRDGTEYQADHRIAA